MCESNKDRMVKRIGITSSKLDALFNVKKVALVLSPVTNLEKLLLRNVTTFVQTNELETDLD